MIGQVHAEIVQAKAQVELSIQGRNVQLNTLVCQLVNLDIPDPVRVAHHQILQLGGGQARLEYSGNLFECRRAQVSDDGGRLGIVPIGELPVEKTTPSIDELSGNRGHHHIEVIHPRRWRVVRRKAPHGIEIEISPIELHRANPGVMLNPALHWDGATVLLHQEPDAGADDDPGLLRRHGDIPGGPLGIAGDLDRVATILKVEDNLKKAVDGLHINPLTYTMVSALPVTVPFTRTFGCCGWRRPRPGVRPVGCRTEWPWVSPGISPNMGPATGTGVLLSPPDAEAAERHGQRRTALGSILIGSSYSFLESPFPVWAPSKQRAGQV